MLLLLKCEIDFGTFWFKTSVIRYALTCFNNTAYDLRSAVTVGHTF